MNNKEHVKTPYISCFFSRKARFCDQIWAFHFLVRQHCPLLSLTNFDIQIQSFTSWSLFWKSRSALDLQTTEKSLTILIYLLYQSIGNGVCGITITKYE